MQKALERNLTSTIMRVPRKRGMDMTFLSLIKGVGENQGLNEDRSTSLV